MDLFNFSEGSAQFTEVHSPLPDRMRPVTFDEIVGQEEITGEGRPFRILAESGQAGSVIFWGPPGCGKTTLAQVMSRYADAIFLQLSAVTSGVKDLKDAFEAAKNNRKVGKKTVLFVDEIHRFNKAQQDALLPHVESGLITLIGATTENPSFEVVAALLSRCRVVVLRALSKSALIQALVRALAQDEKINFPVVPEISDESLESIAEYAQGDARIALNMLETAVNLARNVNPEKPVVTQDLLAETFKSRVFKYDKTGEEHYNLISALHKSLRGSDPDAALYWLYRIIESGENSKFVLRRMIRFAAEDVGMADPFALTLAMSAAQAFDYTGPPEGHLFLAQLAVYLAAAPKSNSLYVAEKKAKAFIRQNPDYPVPQHLRNAPTKLMKNLGYAKDYRYPHDFPDAFVKENYFPDEMPFEQFYEPNARGKENNAIKQLKERWPERYKK
ncbi:MAG: replication-associated recombination protein A [Candidatus Riflebacteria bacterium]|nr:replication-associated recombination protein A [Candidatus Riflebacteria bacterium]